MKRTWAIRFCVVCLGLFALLASTGCVEWAAANLLSFGSGWLLRDLTMTTTTEYQCYRNGVLVDCSTLPEDVRG